jgi:excisionase family DNA binding protein
LVKNEGKQAKHRGRMDKVLLTPREAADALGIGRSKLYELLKTGALASVLIGASRRIPADALASFVSGLQTARTNGAHGST